MERPLEPLLVWRKTANRHILECYQPGTDPRVSANIIRVQVRDNSNFLPHRRDGQPGVIPARRIQAGLYELVGTCPRTRGGPVGGPAAALMANHPELAGRPITPGKAGEKTPAAAPATL